VRKVFQRCNECKPFELVDTWDFYDPFSLFYSLCPLFFDFEEGERKAKNIAKLKSAIKERIYSTDANIKFEMEKIVDEYIRYYIPESIANSIQALHTEKPPLEESKESEVDSVSEENVCDVDTEINGRLSGTKVEDVLESVKSKKPENIPLFKDSNGDGIVYKGQTSLLYSDPKVGKTLLSIEIAKSSEIKKPLFILLDDSSDRQHYRYESLISNKPGTKLITEDRWEEKKEIIKKEMQEKNKEQAMQNVLLNFFPEKNSVELVMDMQKEIKKLNKESGIEEKTLLNDFLVLKRIMNEAVSDDVDFICIDTLRGLMGKTIILNYAILNKIINIPSKNNITTLLLHHTNKDHEVATSKDLERKVDNIYKLSKDISNNDSGKSYLVIETESRYGPCPSVKIERTISDDDAVIHTIISIDNNLKTLNKKEILNLRNKIKNVILNYDQSEIAFDVLVEEICKKYEKHEEKPIINELPALGKEGLIKMTDGKTWKGGITIIKTQDLLSDEIVAETTTNT
jgi:predicted ATP-dependent serine protease